MGSILFPLPIPPVPDLAAPLPFDVADTLDLSELERLSSDPSGVVLLLAAAAERFSSPEI